MSTKDRVAIVAPSFACVVVLQVASPLLVECYSLLATSPGLAHLHIRAFEWFCSRTNLDFGMPKPHE